MAKPPREVPKPKLSTEVQVWPLSKFKAYLDNPRSHSEAAVAQFAKALLRFGFRVPVLASFKTGDLTDGHFRLKAAEKAGLTEVTVMDSDDMSDLEVRAFRLSVNKMAELPEWSQDPLLRELDALKAAGEQLTEDGPVGFEIEEYDAQIATTDWDFSPVADVCVITITGSLPMEDEIRERLRGLEGVVVECSTLSRPA